MKFENCEYFLGEYKKFKILSDFRFNDIWKYVCILYESSLELVLGVVPMSLQLIFSMTSVLILALIVKKWGFL
jgi:hypothetical protein